MQSIRSISAEEGIRLLPELVALLQDAVEDGASVGFLLPLAQAMNERYWEDCLTEVHTGNRILLVAQTDGNLAGSVQLDLATKPNALHRAEVQKLLVHTRYRKQGFGSRLMAAVEDVARQLGRTLLVLDTLEGDNGERLYERCGYIRVGEIPKYARLSDGSLRGTVVFYKLLNR